MKGIMSMWQKAHYKGKYHTDFTGGCVFFLYIHTFIHSFIPNVLVHQNHCKREKKEEYRGVFFILVKTVCFLRQTTHCTTDFFT